MLYALRGAYLSKVHDALKRYTIRKMVDHMCGMYIFGTQQNCVLYYLHPLSGISDRAKLHCMKGTCHICQCKFQQSRFLTLHPTYMVCSTTLCAQSAKNCPIRQQKVAVGILQPGPLLTLCIT